MSVAIEDGDSREAVSILVLETIKNAMDNGELLSENTPEVEKVQYIGEFDDDDIFVPVPVIIDEKKKKEENNAFIFGAAFAASFAAVAALLAVFFFGRRKNKDYDDVSSVVSLGFGVGSFVGPDMGNLAKGSSAMDVHNCKSQTCVKCYGSDPLKFVPAELNEQGKFAKDNIHAVPSAVSSDSSSDSLSVRTQSFECNGCFGTEAIH